jgi:hypothetical protein
MEGPVESRGKSCLLDSMADDYEDFEILSKAASKLASEHGQAPSRTEIIEALEQLINEGLAQAYILSPTRPHATPVTFCRNDVEQIWFYVTPEGKRLIKSAAQNGR